MSMQDHTLDPQLAAADADAQVLEDVKLLERAAKEWRWLAWLWLFGGAVFSAPLMIRVLLSTVNFFNGLNPGPQPHLVFEFIGLLLLVLFFGLISSLYFLIARRIARCQRWAVGLALFIAALATFATVTKILVQLLRNQAWHPPLVMDAVMLLAHLNLLRVLYRSYGAALRIRRLAFARLEQDASLS
jgi:hypothetical protein